MLDLQVTNLSISICGKDALPKFRIIMSPKKTTRQPIKYFSAKARVIMAERAKLLSVFQSVEEFNDDFVPRLRKEAR